MGSFYPIQTGFTAGEVSKRARGRLDLPLYKYGLESCLNFEPLPQGSLRMRAGTKHVLNFVGADERARLLQFHTASAEDFLIVLLDSAMRLFDVDGAAVQALPIGGTELVQNGDFSLGPSAWTAGGDWNRGHCSITGGVAHMQIWFGPGPSGALRYASLEQTLVLTDPAQSLALQMTLTGILNQWTNLVVKLGTTPGGSELVNYKALASTAPVFNVGAVAAGNLYLYIAVQTDAMEGAPPIAYEVAGFDLSAVSCRATFQNQTYDIPAPWTANEVADVKVCYETNNDRMFFFHPNHAPYYLQLHSDGTWSFGNIALAGTPSVWNGTNWPSVGEIYQGRLVVAATPNEKNRIWASKSGSLFDFTIGSNPGDAFDYKVSTKGEIRWLKDHRTLLFGTDISSHSVNASTGLLAPGDVQPRKENAFGCSKIQAVDAGEHAIYVSRDGRKVRAAVYGFQSDGWGSKDVTFFADHITEGKLKELHFATEPTGTIVGLLKTGAFALCTYVTDPENPQKNVEAWWRVELPGATVISAALTRVDDGALLWLITERNGTFRLENIPLHDVGAQYLDAYITATPAVKDAPVPVAHLPDGTTVRVLIDGVLQPDQQVVAGAIVAPDDGGTIVIGVPFEAEATTLPLEGGEPAGTSQAGRFHLNQIHARLSNSAPPLLNDKRAGKERAFGAFVNKLEELVTADVGVRTLKVAQGGQITIKQDLPYRTEVCAVFAQARVEQVG